MAAPFQQPPNVYEAASEYRAALLAREQATVDDMTRRWQAARHEIRREIEAVTARIARAVADGKHPVILPYGSMFAEDEYTGSWLYRVGRLQELENAISAELAIFTEGTAKTVNRRIVTELGHGETDALSLTRFRMRDDGLIVPGQFTKLPADALAKLASFMGENGPEPLAFRDMGRGLIDSVRQRLFDGVAAGKNPRVIGRLMQADTEAGGILDRPLYEQVRVARTEPVRAYREASRETYQANSDIVAGWEWHAAKTLRTCPYCLAMDGTFHDLAEVMATHPQCRCTQLPFTELSQKLQQSGAEYLYGLSPEDQDRVFRSKTMGELYRRGEIQLADIPETFTHPKWGPSGRAASLESLMDRGVVTRAQVTSARSPRGTGMAQKFTAPANTGTDGLAIIVRNRTPKPAAVPVPDPVPQLPAEPIINPTAKPSAQPQEWRPTMTPAEYKTWAADSVIKRPQLHVTDMANTPALLAEGFKLEGTRWARVWGEGVYMTDSPNVRDFYLNAKSWAGRKVELETLTLGVNVRRVLTVSAGPGDYGFANIVAKELGIDAETLASRANAIRAEVRQAARDVENLSPEEIRNTLRQRFGTADVLEIDAEWLAVQAELRAQGYDALRVIDTGSTITGNVGGDQLVIFDPKQVTVIKK